jgi:hypothetical protein
VNQSAESLVGAEDFLPLQGIDHFHYFYIWACVKKIQTQQAMLNKDTATIPWKPRYGNRVLAIIGITIAIFCYFIAIAGLGLGLKSRFLATVLILVLTVVVIMFVLMLMTIFYSVRINSDGISRNGLISSALKWDEITKYAIFTRESKYKTLYNVVLYGNNDKKLVIAEEAVKNYDEIWKFIHSRIADRAKEIEIDDMNGGGSAFAAVVLCIIAGVFWGSLSASLATRLVITLCCTMFIILVGVFGTYFGKVTIQFEKAGKWMKVMAYIASIMAATGLVAFIIWAATSN